MAITSLIAPATKLIGKFVKDKTKQMELAHEISTMAEKHSQELALAQIKLNTEEAKGNWFQSSWRPLCGWICAISLGINFYGSSYLCWIWDNNTPSRYVNNDATIIRYARDWWFA